MYKAKINEIKYDISTNTTDIYELKIEKNIAQQNADIKIRGIELDVRGKFILNFKTPEDVIAKYGKNKIVLADISGNGIPNGELFEIVGHLQIERALIVDNNKKFVRHVRTNDAELYTWNLSKGNKFDSNTTKWQNIRSTNNESSIAKLKNLKQYQQAVNEGINVSDATSVFPSGLPTGYGVAESGGDD